MMNFIVKTNVQQDYKTVFKGFTKELFLALTPPGIKMKLVEFGGCEKDDAVEMELNFILFKQRWRSVISSAGEKENEHYFVDEAKGKNLPFFLKEWKHLHRVVQTAEGTEIIDDINYKAPLGLNWLLYPVLKWQFNYRKPIYKKRFA